MSITDTSPLEKALDDHLEGLGLPFGREVTLWLAMKAVAYGQLAAQGETDWLDHLLVLGTGEKWTVAEVIDYLHLNSFIMKGGESV